MRRRSRLIRLLSLFLCVLLLSAGMHAAARETTLSCEYRTITQNGFVADTFWGVEARYNLYGPTIYCSELIPRFYREVYGVEIAVGDGGPRVTDESGCRFEEITNPGSGDVLLAAADSRGKSYNHWAICKAADPASGRITLFEQNWRWNGCAGVNRVIPMRGSCYRAYRLVAEDGTPAPTLAELEAQALAQAQRQEEEAARLAVVQIRNDLRREAIRAASLVL